MHRVLVTGATGFVGSQVVLALSELGYEVHGVSRRRGAGVRGASCHEADLTDPAAAASVVAEVRPDCIVHTAWYVGRSDYASSPENRRWVGASARLVEAAARVGCRRVVVTGTCAEYDWSVDVGQRRREDSSCAPSSAYGAAKCRCRSVLEDLCDANAVAMVWARLFHLFGPGDSSSRLVAGVVRSLEEGRDAVVRAGGLTRDFASTVDVGRALAHLVAADVTGPVNVASGVPVTLGDLARRVGALMGRSGSIVVEDDRPASEVESMVADVELLRSAVGVVPAPAMVTMARDLRLLRSPPAQPRVRVRRP